MRRLALAAVLASAFAAAPVALGQAGEWTWVGGSDVSTPQRGVYGTRGVPAPGNLPANRSDASSATDSNGHFWLFGGTGVGLSQNLANDLWEFNPDTKEWTWWSGGEAAIPGVYGTLGVAASANLPGSREDSVLWSDHNGNVWLFGGFGYSSDANVQGALNDLWRFDVKTGEWTWMAGGNTLPDTVAQCQHGSYGTQGVPSSTNLPVGRQDATAWTSSDGNLWLFGGGGCRSVGGVTLLNDLWEFDLTSGEWTWISGGSAGNSAGIYGTRGIPSEGGPGSRWYATNMGTDSGGNFWLFGGNGYDSSGTADILDLNDLWQFSPATKQWTWQSGSSTSDQMGFYGTLSHYGVQNVPGAREGGAGSIDSKGRLRLFGGVVYDDYSAAAIEFNDVWFFDPLVKQWVWVGGSDTPVCFFKSGVECTVFGEPASYGLLGAAAPSNVPGSRSLEATWTDTAGNLWLFGGAGVDSAGNEGSLNDLWSFAPPVLATPVPTAPVFGTMTFSPTATVIMGTSEAITIADTLTYSGVQPTGVVTYVLNGVAYTATCIQAGIGNGSPETCSAQVPADTIAALPSASYPVTGSLAADGNYNAITAPGGTFTVTGNATGCTVPAPSSNTMKIAYYTLAESDRDGNNLANGVSPNYVLSSLGTNGLPVFNPDAMASQGGISTPKDLLSDSEITWWSPQLNNGGANGNSDVVATSIGVVPLPFNNDSFFPPNGTGSNDANGFQTAVLTGTLVAPAPETVSFTIASDDMAFLYLDGQIACDDGGVHGPTSVPCTTSTLAAGTHTLQLFYADLNRNGAALDFSVTTSNVGVGAGNQLVFGTMTFSPAATEPQGTGQAITISDTITYSGAQPTGPVSFVLNNVHYAATCTTGASPETCSAVVPAAMIAALSPAAYPVSGSFAGDCNYTAVTAPAGTFTIIQQQVTFGTMTFSPVATVLVGTSQAITIGDTLSYPGVQPTGAVSYVLNGVGYPATCTGEVSPETCTAQVPAATIAALPAATYPVTGSFSGDSVYAAATAAPGTFTVTLPPPDFSMAAAPLTIVTQHHANTTISITPINGFSGIVDLSCGTVPAYVTCEWEPSSVTVSGGMASTVLKIDTSGIIDYLASTQPSAPPLGSKHGAARFVLAGLAFPALLLLRRRRKTAVRLTLCLLALASMLHLTGCSSRYPDSTVPGTYSITIQGTSGAIRHSAVLTLVVTQ